MNLFDKLKSNLVRGLVSRYGPAISLSISGAVGGLVTKAISFAQEKAGPQLWEMAVNVFHGLPDDLEAQLTPERLGLAAGALFYAGLQEWLNRRQASGIESVQKAANSVLPESQKVKVDGVVTKGGETAKTVQVIAHKSRAGGGISGIKG
jgi:hypothetical protein